MENKIKVIVNQKEGSIEDVVIPTSLNSSHRFTSENFDDENNLLAKLVLDYVMDNSDDRENNFEIIYK